MTTACLFHKPNPLISRFVTAMKKSTESTSAKRSRFNFSLIEKRLDSIIQDAEGRLAQLVSEERIQNFRELTINPYLNEIASSTEKFHDRSEERVSFQLRLGSTRLTLSELARLDYNTIVPLLESTSGQVQIWSNGRLYGRGVLLVADGKLAVKIESIER